MRLEDSFLYYFSDLNRVDHDQFLQGKFIMERMPYMDQMLGLSHSRDPWYVVHCKARKELHVSTMLNVLGIVTFCPELNNHNQEEVHRLPLFPGYIFIQV